MDLTKSILLKTFSSTTAADVAVSQLRGHGIECVITTDDCGGIYPPLGAIKLLVDPAVADDAREILKLSLTDESTAPLPEEISIGPDVPPPRVFRFNSGLIAGAIIGALLHFSYTQHHRFRSATVR